MKYSFLKVNIESPFPTTQCGHSCQTELIYEHRDHQYARIISFKDEKHWIYHISFDLLCFTLESRNEIQNYLRKNFNNDDIVVITSATHTHYANSARNKDYVNYVIDLLCNQIVTMDYKEMGVVTSSFDKIHSTACGKSRISGHESNLEFLCLLRFYSDNKNFLTIVINNCHPTTLHANVPYFSSEYPGYVLKKLEDAYPNENFSFIMGASGDISSRFVRTGQDYEAMSLIGENLFKEIIPLKEKESIQKELTLDYKEVDLAYTHEFSPIDTSSISGLSERELETIEIGQQMREKMKNTPSLIFGKLPDSVRVGALSLGSIKIIFYPNEIFSEYLNYLDLDTTYLVSYSNGYGPYILPIGFKHVTYEMFIDTLTDDTKKRLIQTIQSL